MLQFLIQPLTMPSAACLLLWEWPRVAVITASRLQHGSWLLKDTVLDLSHHRYCFRDMDYITQATEHKETP